MTDEKPREPAGENAPIKSGIPGGSRQHVRSGTEQGAVARPGGATQNSGGGESVVDAFGPDNVQEALRKAMSMGVDRAVHLKADSIPADGIAIAKALAAELKDGAYDVILFGKHAFDTSAGVVGTAVAE